MSKYGWKFQLNRREDEVLYEGALAILSKEREDATQACLLADTLLKLDLYGEETESRDSYKLP